MILDHIKSRLSADPILFTLLLVFIVFGLLMVYSSTSIISFKRFGFDTHYVLNHFIHIFIGICVALLFATLNLDWIRKMTYPLILISILLMILPFIPGIGQTLGGASRWIQVLGFRFQPSEVCKIPFLLYLAYSLSKKLEQGTLDRFSIGVLPHLLMGGLFALLLLLQPDFGTATIYFALLLFMFFVAGIQLKKMFWLFCATLPVIVTLIVVEPYRLQRVLSFLNPWADPGNKGFQILQALTSFSSGQFFGKGLGNSQGKLFFIPQAHSDFIFSVMGEEIGFLGIVIFLILWSIFILRGFRIAEMSKKPYIYLISSGVTFLLLTQSLIHMLVNLSLLPPKGMNMPFISTGGSNLIVVMALTGLLMNCAARNQQNHGG